MAKRNSSTMSDTHKEALSKGRSESKVVRAYLEALASKKRGPGRRRTPEAINKQLAMIAEDLMEASGLDELLMRQKQRDLEAELASLSTEDLASLEKAFVKVGRSFAQRRGIERATWRDMHVPAEVLDRAKIQ